MKNLLCIKRQIAIGIFISLLLISSPVVAYAEDYVPDNPVSEDQLVVTLDREKIKGKSFAAGQEITFTFDVSPVSIYGVGIEEYVELLLYDNLNEDAEAIYKIKVYYTTSSEPQEITTTITMPEEDIGTWYATCFDHWSGLTPRGYLTTFYVVEPTIKGICQMPYTGDGGGYLIGIETYKNENYMYEMLILDCTLLRDGKDAWVYTTGKCYAPETCLWTVWQPQYGYYWTLFRVYDSSGVMLEEQCYGFVNAY